MGERGWGEEGQGAYATLPYIQLHMKSLNENETLIFVLLRVLCFQGQPLLILFEHFYKGMSRFMIKFCHVLLYIADTLIQRFTAFVTCTLGKCENKTKQNKENKQTKKIKKIIIINKNRKKKKKNI